MNGQKFDLVKELTSLPMIFMTAWGIGDSLGFIPEWVTLVMLLTMLFGGYALMSEIDKRLSE